MAVHDGVVVRRTGLGRALCTSMVWVTHDAVWGAGMGGMVPASVLG